MKKTSILFFAFILSTSLSLKAQYFSLVSDATKININEYKLTPAEWDKVGAMWYNNKVDLTKNFNISYMLYFGNDESLHGPSMPYYSSGADGIAFALQSHSLEFGSEGEGIGYGGMTPSIVCEFDTFINDSSWSPTHDPLFDTTGFADHMCIMINGNPSHADSTKQQKPVNLGNIEDTSWHHVNIQWEFHNDSTQTFMIIFDDKDSTSYTTNIIDSIFKGDPLVYWGFTSSTGGFFNEHIVKFISIDESIPNYQNDTIVIEENQAVIMPTPALLGQSYNWTPKEFFDDANIQTPTFTHDSSGLYTVSVNILDDIEKSVSEITQTFIINVGNYITNTDSTDINIPDSTNTDSSDSTSTDPVDMDSTLTNNPDSTITDLDSTSLDSTNIDTTNDTDTDSESEQTTGISKNKNESINMYFDQSNTLVIDALEPSKNGLLTIYNMNGQTQIEQILTKARNTVNLNNLQNGIYIVKYSGEHAPVVKKIFVYR